MWRYNQLPFFTDRNKTRMSSTFLVSLWVIICRKGLQGDSKHTDLFTESYITLALHVHYIFTTNQSIGQAINQSTSPDSQSFRYWGIQPIRHTVKQPLSVCLSVNQSIKWVQTVNHSGTDALNQSARWLISHCLSICQSNIQSVS